MNIYLLISTNCSLSNTKRNQQLQLHFTLKNNGNVIYIQYVKSHLVKAAIVIQTTTKNISVTINRNHSQLHPVLTPNKQKLPLTGFFQYTNILKTILS